MIGIMICCCYKYIKQYEKIFELWKNIENNNKKFKIFFLFGDPTIDTTKFDNVTNQLILKINDTYDDLPKKIYEGINFIYSNYPRIKGIYKTDDDIEYENIDKLIKKIKSNYKNKINYSGLVIDITKGGSIKKKRLIKFSGVNNINDFKYDDAVYCYGAGYYISKKSMNYIIINKNYMYNQKLEDVCIGHILNIYNIYPLKIDVIFKEIERT